MSTSPDNNEPSLLILQANPEDVSLENAYKRYTMCDILKGREISFEIPEGEQCFSLDPSNGVVRWAPNPESFSANVKGATPDPIYNEDDTPIVYAQFGGAFVPLVRFFTDQQTAFSQEYNRLPIKKLVDLLGRDAFSHQQRILFYRAFGILRSMTQE